MRYRQTEKFIGGLNQSVGKPTKRKVGDWNFATKFSLAGTKAKRLKSADSLGVNEKIAVSQQLKKTSSLRRVMYC